MNCDTNDLTVLMDEAVVYCRDHVESGGLPFVGQVVTEDGHVSEYGVNLVRETGDSSAHAEIVAMRAVLRDRGPRALEGSTLLATGEPCALCYRFAADHGVAVIRYAVDRDTAARWGFDYRASYAAFGTDRLPLSRTALHRPVDRGLDPFTRYSELHGGLSPH